MLGHHGWSYFILFVFQNCLNCCSRSIQHETFSFLNCGPLEPKASVLTSELCWLLILFFSFHQWASSNDKLCMTLQKLPASSLTHSAKRALTDMLSCGRKVTLTPRHIHAPTCRIQIQPRRVRTKIWCCASVTSWAWVMNRLKVVCKCVSKRKALTPHFIF